VPTPLVVEIWSPFTDDYDITAKLPGDRRRGDLETWDIHPLDRTPTMWRKQPDGTYARSDCHDGIIRPNSLPGVDIDLDALFSQ
jgi:Uma2 family endonuclease